MYTYYFTFADVKFLDGGKAWQSSTFIWYGVSLTAEKAIDGDTNGNAKQNFCSHTNSKNSYWAVEFGTAGPVKEVKIQLRTDQIGKINNFIRTKI